MGIPSDTEYRLNFYVNFLFAALCEKLIDKKLLTEKDRDKMFEIAKQATEAVNVEEQRKQMFEEFKKQNQEKAQAGG
jgi:hypothetical protein